MLRTFAFTTSVMGDTHTNATSQLLKKRPVTAASCSGTPSTSRLYSVIDASTETNFLVDSGAKPSVLPPRTVFRPPSTLVRVHHNTWSTLPHFRYRLAPSSFVVLPIADVTHAVLGAEILNNFGLPVDIRSKQLINIHTMSIRFLK